MARSANSFQRGPSRYKPQPTVLVICEDSKSGKRYLEDATRHFRVNVTVEITHCGKTDPKGIVIEAIQRQKNFDKVFCTIDRDTHENFDEATKLARTSVKLEVIPSYPCFEFWYLLHFGPNRKPYTAAGNKSAGDQVLSNLRTLDGMAGYAKGGTENVFETLLPRLPLARQLSPQVLAQALQDGNLNPSTRVHELIAYFEQLAELQMK